MIEVSEGIDVNKTSASKECIICHYWYFLDKGINLQLEVCNGWHNVLMMSMNINDIAILNIHAVDYHLLLMELPKLYVCCKMLI